MTRTLISTFTLIFAAAFATTPWADEAGDLAEKDRSEMDPVEVIEYTAQLALDTLEARRDEFAEDTDALYRAIDGILLPVFDIQRSGDLVLGRHAREASAEQRRRFAQALYESLVRQYADSAVDFSPDLVVRPLRGDTDPRATRVESEVRLDDGTRVSINYVLRETDDGWKVFDVIAEGISYVRNFRSQYDAEIRRRGLDEVISRLERAIERGEVDDVVPELGEEAEAEESA